MNLKDLKGVGPKTITLLNKLHIMDFNDLVSFYPYKYNILEEMKLEDIIDNGGVINGVIESEPKIAFVKKNFNILSFRFVTPERIVNVSIFNRVYLKHSLEVGKRIAIIGKYNPKRNNLVASDIKFEEIKQREIIPVYHLVSGISNTTMTKIFLNVNQDNISVEDNIPSYLVDRYNFLSKRDAVYALHHPNEVSDIKNAKLRTIYEEFFIFMFKMNYLRMRRIKGDFGKIRQIDYRLVQQFIDSLPFELTADQLMAVREIYKDFTTDKRMNRLILGDVGSGKTIVSIIALFMNYISGFQGVLMAPTEILARQHLESIRKLMPGIKVYLLVGSMTVAAKKSVAKSLANGDIDILIGTHAVLSEDVKFNNLGLVITDEQHRFGVNQRKIIQNKGKKTDILYMSATPIPRTYALFLYGDMDLSMIESKPSGRRDIVTKVKKESEIRDVLEAILNELKQGHQVYIIAPLIDDEEESANDIKKLYDNYNRAFGGKYNIGVLHGKMNKDKKNKIMVDYKDKKIDILISTTVIEVGIDVKNATLMVVYNAEKFGLATLHQLRGRVGRNELTSYCYLICNMNVARLKVMEESNDGFYISEKDFEMRGEGDLFGIKQSGDMVFKMGNIKNDYKILMQCRKDSEEYLENFDNNDFYENIIKNLEINN